MRVNTILDILISESIFRKRCLRLPHKYKFFNPQLFKTTKVDYYILPISQKSGNTYFGGRHDSLSGTH